MSDTNIENSGDCSECNRLEAEIRYLKNRLRSEVNLQAENESLKKENERLKQGLEDVAYPIKRMQRIARESGAELNGPYAVMLSGSAEYLKEIALKAINPDKV